MNSTRSTSPAVAAPKTAAPIPQPESKVRTEVRSDLHNSVRSATNDRKSLAFGLPCANCRLYYPANLDACPACNSTERVSPTVSPVTPVPQTATEPEADAAVLERERDAFLKQFKSQILAGEAELKPAAAVCTLGAHQEAPEAATICKACYDHLQERVDVFEAAMHIDLKEAAQIVYDAVWADPSDPSKTYTNAASALLNELRKRTGVSSLLGPFHPLGN